MRILLIAGGWSNEREVSLRGAESIQAALQELGHEVQRLDPALEFSRLLQKASSCDFAFINLHGSPGEDGLIQALLEQVGCPYQGSGPKGSLLALHKSAAKEIFRNTGLATPRWEYLPCRVPRDWKPVLDLPLVLKPNFGGSSLHVSLIQELPQLLQKMQELWDMGWEVILEERIPGQEITCAVLGLQALPPILIQPAQDSAFFDYYSKYTPQAAQEICPAPISRELTARIQDMALRAHRALDLQGYSRSDFLVLEEQPYLLEVNTLPGMTSTSLLPQAAQAQGYNFQELIAELISLGLNA
ncbi:MAG: D-alanine--D-alanine ligase family protein [Thermodesulfobacteriota bacterium]